MKRERSHGQRFLKSAKFLINSALLLTISALSAADIPSPNITAQLVHGPKKDRGARRGGHGYREPTNQPAPMTSPHIQPTVQPYTYDDVLDLIEELEEGDLDDRCSPEQLNSITQFMALLAREGVLPDDINGGVLESDIQELLAFNDIGYSIYQDGDYLIIPAIYYGQGEVFLCKSWFKKRWEATKEFVKKHKVAIIIGAAIVVAAVVIVCVVVASASAATAASAAGVASAGGLSGSEGSQPDGKKEEEAKSPPSEPQPETANPPIIQESPTLKAVLDEQISSFKEMVVEDSLLKIDRSMPGGDPSLIDKARELGSYLAHETFDSVSQLASVLPELASQINDLGGKIFPNISSENDLLGNGPKENYAALVVSGHGKIDQIFGTDQADWFTPEAKERNPFIAGSLPLPPGLLGASTSAMGNGRIAATQASSTWGWKVGDPVINRTAFGFVPKWSTVRRRHWKNRAEWAKSNPHNYGDNISRMEQGLAPQQLNQITGKIETMELHHIPAQRDGGLFDFIEVWPDEHARLDPSRYLGK